MIALLLLLLLTSCVWSVTIEDPITKADTTRFAVDTTENDTIDIDIQIDTTMIPISFEVTVEEWENKET